jgi:hypothetical protein
MNGFNEMCSTEVTLNNNRRKNTKIIFYKAATVLILTCLSKIRSMRKQQEANIETAQMIFLCSVAGYTRNGQIRNIKLGKNSISYI